MNTIYQDEDRRVWVDYKYNGVMQPPWDDYVYPTTEENALKCFWEEIDMGVGDREKTEVVNVCLP
tara:strand:+ start:1070 stop:1264 length:195 start_codon:yes stop_codon:yes gene_type:complete